MFVLLGSGNLCVSSRTVPANAFEHSIVSTILQRFCDLADFVNCRRL